MELDYIKVFKALSDDTRLKIVTMLSQGTLCACDILDAFSITQPTLSYHMKQLVDAGLVSGERQGNWVHYSLNHHGMIKLNEFIADLTGSTK